MSDRVKQCQAERMIARVIDVDGDRLPDGTVLLRRPAPLCSYMVLCDLGWRRAWWEMAAQGVGYMPDYFGSWYYTSEEAALLRMLTIHLWLRHDFPESKPKNKRGKA